MLTGLFFATLFLGTRCSSSALTISSQGSSRRNFFRATATLVPAAALLSRGAQSSAVAAGENGAISTSGGAKLGLSDAELKTIIKSDLLDRHFLATGDLTRSVYKPTATFTDEIDTYGIDQWIKGTQKLFVGSKSDVRLIGDVDVTAEKVEFRFDEDLMFNIPFKPVVSLSGKVVLTRDDSGYITSYREFWDQDVATVLKTAKF